MFWHILPHATLCIASDRLILLDVRQDRYLMIANRIDRDLRSWLAEDEATTAPTRLRQLLEQSDVLREGDDRLTNARPSTVTIPQTLARPQTGREVGTGCDLVRIGALVTATWLALRWKPLHQILRGIGRRPTLPRDSASAGMPAAVGSYDRARIYVPFTRRCLLDSLAMQAWLQRHHEHSQLVFGVTGQPFAAHCWLQNDDVRGRRYTFATCGRAGHPQEAGKLFLPVGEQARHPACRKRRGKGDAQRCARTVRHQHAEVEQRRGDPSRLPVARGHNGIELAARDGTAIKHGVQDSGCFG
jgi:hypothetical protein